MKKLLMLVLPVFLLLQLFMAQTGQAAKTVETRLYLNDRQLAPEVPPRNVNGVVLVPVRIVTEALGAVVDWNPKLEKVTVDKADLRFTFQINKLEATVGNAVQKLEVAPINDSGNTLLPVRLLAENMGLRVEWDQAGQAVRIYEKSPEPPAQGGSGTGSNGNGKPNGTVEINAVSFAEDKLVIQANGSVKPNLYTLSNPDRLVIDLPNSLLGKPLKPDAGKAINAVAAASADLAPPGTAGSAPSNGKAGQASQTGQTEKNGQANQNGQAGTAAGAAVTVNATGDQSLAHQAIGTIRYAQYTTEPPVVRVVVDLKSKIFYNLLESSAPGTIVVGFGDTPVTKPPDKNAKYKVVIDAGHGDKDSGAVSITQRYEKEFTLAMALKVQKLLQKEASIEVLMTRSDDTFVELDDRVAFANSRKADVFVSIHGNKFSPTVSGTETYYSRDESLPLAKLLHANIVAAAGFPDRNVRKNDFRVIKATTMPAVLCEIGYLSNKDDESQMYKEDFQNKVAEAIANGIKQFLQISK